LPQLAVLFNADIYKVFTASWFLCLWSMYEVCRTDQKTFETWVYV